MTKAEKQAEINFQEWCKKSRAMDDRVEEAIKAVDGRKTIYVNYSAWNGDEKDMPVDNLDEIAIKGDVILFQDRDEFFGGPKSKNYQSEVLHNPTWLTVAIHANRMIRATGDKHHIFLEGVVKTKAKIDGIVVYTFSMGS
jgi:hypothetical protein